MRALEACGTTKGTSQRALAGPPSWPSSSVPVHRPSSGYSGKKRTFVGEFTVRQSPTDFALDVTKGPGMQLILVRENGDNLARVWEGEAISVVARTTEGDIGLLAHHEPMIAPLVASTAEVTTPDGRR